MATGDLNSIAVLGRELLLVEVGVGVEIHLARESAGPGRAAVDDPDGPDAGVAAPRWDETTMCGRTWHRMAPGADDPVSLWHEPAFAPSCRSCLRLVDKWFPVPDAPLGVPLLAAVVAEQVVEFGSTYVTGIPAEHLEATRRAIRKALRSGGFRSNTHAVDGVLHVWSDEAYYAIDPAVLGARVNEAMERIGLGAEAPNPIEVGSLPAPIDWHTWVIDD